jgi:hypothetical protein
MAWDNKRRTSADYLHPKQRQRTLRQHAEVCHICGHGGAEEVDHIVPWAEWHDASRSVHTPSNLAPAHGQPCPTCGRHCHSDKTKAEAARGRAKATQARRLASRRPAETHPGALP